MLWGTCCSYQSKTVKTFYILSLNFILKVGLAQVRHVYGME